MTYLNKTLPTFSAIPEEMNVTARLAPARSARALVANLKFTFSTISQNHSPTKSNSSAYSYLSSPPSFIPLILAQIRSFLLLSTIFAPVGFYILFISSSFYDKKPFGSLLPFTSSISWSSSPASNLFDPVDLTPGYIPAPRHSLQHNIGLLPFSPSQDPTVRQVFACHANDPCCDYTYVPALRAALLLLQVSDGLCCC